LTIARQTAADVKATISQAQACISKAGPECAELFAALTVAVFTKRLIARAHVRVATEAATADDALLSGVLRDAAKGKGNFGLGGATQAQARTAGEAWVGQGYSVASDGKTLISADGLRQFRPPSYKPNLGRWQANFEERLVPQGQWQSNGHLDIQDIP
jgi:hypothetical protein